MSKKKQAKKTKNLIVIDGISTAEMSKEEIQKYVVLLREELDKERGERNMLSLERDKLTTFWELSKSQTDDATAMLRKKERELEDAEERHQLEMRVYRQKIKHLLFEQNAKEAHVKKETSITLNNMTEEARAEIKNLQNANYTLKAQLRYNQLETEESIKMLKRQQETELASVRQQFIRQAEEIELRASQQAMMLRAKLDDQRRNDVHATEERKSLHIRQLEMEHEKSFVMMKSYYNDITLGNVNVIKTLKEHIEDLEAQLSRLQKKLESSAYETTRNSEELKKSEIKNEYLQKAAVNYKTEKTAHAITKTNLKKMTESYNELDMRFDLVQARLEVLEKSRENMVSQLESILIEIQEKSSLRCMILEKKLCKLIECVEAREAQIQHLMIAMNAEPEAVMKARKHLEELLETKNTSIKELQYEVARVGKAYSELWNACHRKLVEELSSPVNLGIQPVDVSVCLRSHFNPAIETAKFITGSALIDKDLVDISPVKLGREPSGLTSVAPS